MEKFVSILIKHGGKWNSSGKYVDFEVEGILYDTSTLYTGLVNSIVTQLNIEENLNSVEIKYIVSEMCPPIKIHNDVGVKVYLDQMRVNLDFFTKYPLCITLKDCGQYNECHRVIVNDIINSDVRLSQNNIDLYSNNSIRLIGMDLDGVVNDINEVDNDIICDHSNLFVAENNIYNNKETLKEVMRHVGLVEKFSFRVARCNSSNYHLHCISKSCSWMMRASSLNKSSLFKVRKYIAQHTCCVRERVYARRQGITDVVAVLIMDNYIDPSKVYTPKDVADDMLKLHGVSLTYIQAWRAKEKAVKLVRGDPADSYARLPGYFYILEQTYPGSVLKIKRNEDDTFLYAFVALEACIRGWEYCRPIVVVDGAALKCSYGGTMLTASTLDPGGHILPLAYAIVDSENDASWTWFFEQFREAYGVRQNMCFMSDRNESIWKGTTNVYPESEHYACIWHLSVNVLKNFNRNTEDLKMLFFSLAKAYTKQQFETIMGRIDQIDTRIRPYLFDIGYSKWSRAYSNCKRTWTMTSNIAESLNNVNRLARRLPVISLLEFMRVTIQRWIHKHNEEADKTTSNLTKKYDVYLQKSITLSCNMRVIPSTVDLHAVAEGAKKYIVNLNTRMCSCGRFQHYEIPCGHAIAVLRYRKLHEADFCSAFYSLKNFKDAYAIPVEPIPCESTWDIPSYISDPKLMPPGQKRAAGRPKLERWKGFADVKFKKTKSTCSRCHQVGHNRKTCSNYPVQKQ